MNDQTKLLVNYRLNRAKETLESAEILLKEDKILSAVNRLYYAMFYSVVALLLTKGLSSAKHTGILALFTKELVNKGIVNKELGRFYSRMFERRQKGDYRDLVEFDKKDVEEWLNKSKEFVKNMEEVVVGLLKEES